MLAAMSVIMCAHGQTKLAGTAVPMNAVGIPVLSADRTVTDTLVGYSWTNTSAAGPVVYPAVGGYVCGNNYYGDKAKVQAFSNSIGGISVEGAIIWFGAKQHDGSAGSSSHITVNEYSLDGPGTSSAGSVATAPGTINASVDVAFSAVDTGSSFASGASTFMFTTPVSTSSDFAIGVDFSQLGSGDTVGIVSSTNGDAGGTEKSWEQAVDNSWSTLYVSWPLDVDLFVWALIDNNGNGITEQGFLNGARLGQNSPNPANGITSVPYDLETSSDQVSLRIFDAAGQLIATYNEGNKAAGHYAIAVETTGLPAGTYYYALTAGKSRIARKMVVTK